MGPSAEYSGSPSWVTGDLVGDYFDPVSGRLFVVARPAAQPELWAAYIDGALRSYRRHGVQDAVDYDRVRDGRSTSLFFAAVEADGSVVGGIRVQGPYTGVDQAYALQEWAGRDGTTQLRREIVRRLADGVIEMKAGWVEHDAPLHGELTSALARIFVHSLLVMNVRYAFCTAASHAIPRWQSSGGVVSPGVTPVAYPDDRYQTLLVWWDRRTVFQLLADQQVPAILSELEQLRRYELSAPLSPRAAL